MEKDQSGEMEDQNFDEMLIGALADAVAYEKGELNGVRIGWRSQHARLPSGHRRTTMHQRFGLFVSGCAFPSRCSRACST